MPSESVWFEQVDTALVAFTQSVVRLPDDGGTLRPVPVTVRKPDEDFKIESYPSITWYNLYSRRDDTRYYPFPVIISRNVGASTLVTEKPAIPYSLVYQMDFWSRLQSHMNDMTRIWLGNNPDKCFNLPVTDMAGNVRSSFVLQMDDLKKVDSLNGTDRTFHSVLTYRVWVELDEKLSTTGPMVTSTREIYVKE